jgi:thioredoxin-related protein
MKNQNLDQNQIILYSPNESISLEVRLENETVWLNRQQIAQLFGRDIKTIGKHINNALREELSNCSVVANFATTATDGKTYNVEYYNINVYDPEYFTEDFVSNTLEDYEKDNDIITYYKITTVPTLLKLDSEGKIINKVTGVLTLEQLKEFLKD